MITSWDLSNIDIHDLIISLITFTYFGDMYAFYCFVFIIMMCHSTKQIGTDIWKFQSV